jgi:hypothetical protein
VAYCAIKAKLLEDVQGTFTELIQLMHRAKETVGIGAPATLASIDQLIELAFGRKERAMGALNQHTKEHGC